MARACGHESLAHRLAGAGRRPFLESNSAPGSQPKGGFDLQTPTGSQSKGVSSPGSTPGSPSKGVRALETVPGSQSEDACTPGATPASQPEGGCTSKAIPGSQARCGCSLRTPPGSPRKSWVTLGGWVPARNKRKLHPPLPPSRHLLHPGPHRPRRPPSGWLISRELTSA